MNAHGRHLLEHVPLKDIDAQIAEIKRMPMADRTVADANRLRELESARNRICGKAW